MERYSRQIILDDIGEEGQKRINAARAAVLGAGGLGSPVLIYLAAAGVGHITVIDDDTVSLSNLNRQVLYTEADLGRAKAEAAAERLAALNTGIEVSAISARITKDNAEELLKGHDIALLCMDDMEGRYAANRGCAALSLPYVEGGIDGLYGTVLCVEPGVTACFECIHRRSAQGGAHIGGALGAAAGTIGSLMALCALKQLMGREWQAGKLLLFDGRAMTMETLAVKRRPDCPACG